MPIDLPIAGRDGAEVARVSDLQALDRRVKALEAGLSRREPIAGGDYGRGEPDTGGGRAAGDLQRLVDQPRVFPRGLAPDTRGDSATGYTRQEQRHVRLCKGKTTISLTGGESLIRALELDGWLPT